MGKPQTFSEIIKMEKLEEKFNENLELWRKHCIENINSSNPETFLDCNAYKNIIAMGKDALPLIRKAYDTESKEELSFYSLRWILHRTVLKIIGNEFKIPKGMYLGSDELADYTSKWLDENIDKYIQR